MKVNEGSIFCIPLFMDKEDWKLTTKLSEKELENDFAFGRVIETTSSVLVEIFNKVGPAHQDLNGIIHSEIMFSPVQLFWDAVIKKRWRVIGQTENYDKFKDSNYGNLKMAFGLDEPFRLRHLSTGKEIYITREEIGKHEYATVWFPIDLENRILEERNSSPQ